VTITLTSVITFTRETVLDGGGLVTLSGGNTTRILYLASAYPTPTPRLTVQRLTFRDGRSAPGSDDTAGGGGAIYRNGGSLTVIDCSFVGNHAPTTGQDLAGGAIYGFGGGETIISGSTFVDNAASNGGAVGSLNGHLTIINSTFTGNAATGTGGNPGHGGCGGAIYMDGRNERTVLCGVTIAGSTAGAIGGGFFRVSNDHTGSFTMDRSTVDANRVTATTSGNAGGLYLEGLSLQITDSTISRNQAFFNGGLWINTCTVQMTNTTIAGNTASGSNGGGLWLGHTPTGTIRNCTIADNHATAPGQVAGAIFGAGLTLVNTVVASNTSMYRPSCDTTRTDGTGNLQWPGGSLCTMSPTIADPMLGTLGNHGGPTETMVPSAGSPARRLGTGCPPTDQLGHARHEPCTAGAVEVP
jgi:parallel beta-helix repeat protein